MNNPFAQDVIDAVIRHMNVDHPQDTLVICRGVGGHTKASTAVMTGFDDEGAEFTAAVDGVEVPVRIAWSQKIDQRPQVRQEIVKLFARSQDQLGL